MAKKKHFILKIQFMAHEPGSKVAYDPEWNEWTINKFTYGYRGSIADGEIAMLLDAMLRQKLSSLLSPVTEA